MEFESIKKIVEAENKANEIKENAKEEAKTILAKTENSKKSMELYINGQLENKKKNLENTKLEEKEKKITKLREETEVKLNNIRKNSEENIPRAVDAVFRKVINI